MSVNRAASEETRDEFNSGPTVRQSRKDVENCACFVCDFGSDAIAANDKYFELWLLSGDHDGGGFVEQEILMLLNRRE